MYVHVHCNGKHMWLSTFLSFAKLHLEMTKLNPCSLQIRPTTALTYCNVLLAFHVMAL